MMESLLWEIRSSQSTKTETLHHISPTTKFHAGHGTISTWTSTSFSRPFVILYIYLARIYCSQYSEGAGLCDSEALSHSTENALTSPIYRERRCTVAATTSQRGEGRRMGCSRFAPYDDCGKGFDSLCRHFQRPQSISPTLQTQPTSSPARSNQPYSNGRTRPT